MNSQGVEVTFLGRQIPLEVKRLVAVLPLVVSSPEASSLITQTIQLVVQHLLGSSTSLLSDSTAQMKQISELNAKLEAEIDKNKGQIKKNAQREQVENALKVGAFPTIFTGFYIIVRSAVRGKLNTDSFAAQLTELQIPAPIVKALAKILKEKSVPSRSRRKKKSKKANQIIFLFFFFSFSRRDTFQSVAVDSGSWYNRVQNIRWRVDVTISSSSMLRVFKPIVLLQVEEQKQKQKQKKQASTQTNKQTNKQH